MHLPYVCLQRLCCPQPHHRPVGACGLNVSPLSDPEPAQPSEAECSARGRCTSAANCTCMGDIFLWPSLNRTDTKLTHIYGGAAATLEGAHACGFGAGVPRD